MDFDRDPSRAAFFRRRLRSLPRLLPDSGLELLSEERGMWFEFRDEPSPRSIMGKQSLPVELEKSCTFRHTAGLLGGNSRQAGEWSFAVGDRKGVN